MLNCGKFSNGHPFCHASPDGDAKCECLPGYKKINDNSCIDIDECDHPDPYRSDSLDLQNILQKFSKKKSKNFKKFSKKSHKNFENSR